MDPITLWVAVCFPFEIIKKSLLKNTHFFQLDEEASVWCPGPDKRQLQIQHSSKALCTNWTEVATQTYHLQVQVPIPTPNLVSFHCFVIFFDTCYFMKMDYVSVISDILSFQRYL